MARKIVWTKIAQEERKNIFKYWNNRNKSTLYSKKLQSLFKESLNLISQNPNIGKLTDIEGVRIKIVRDYLLYYQITSNKVYVLMVWDSRRNPDSLKVRKVI
jgi:addiction module RelE/StbE family toxin